MNEYAKRATHALVVYLERGRRILAFLAESKFDQAEELLRWREAAFHNFKALDARALQAGFDVRHDPEVMATVNALAELKGPLEKALRDWCKKTGRQLGKIRDARQTLNSYRSQAEQRTSFESSV